MTCKFINCVRTTRFPLKNREKHSNFRKRKTNYCYVLFIPTSVKCDFLELAATVIEKCDEKK